MAALSSRASFRSIPPPGVAWREELRTCLSRGWKTSQPWITQAGDWDSYVIGAAKQPKALWPLDSVYRGRNLGFGGQQFDLNVENVMWKDAGPLGKNAGNFAHLDSTTKLSVVAHHGGKKLLDLSKPFTITVWLKTDNRTAIMPIFETYATDNALLFHFIFHPSKSQDQLFMNGPRRAYTTKNNTDRLNWRHIACTHHGESNYSFYLNGNEWLLSHEEDPKPVPEIEIISIGSRLTASFRFFGSMACMMIFDKALTPGEIKSVKSLCG